MRVRPHQPRRLALRYLIAWAAVASAIALPIVYETRVEGAPLPDLLLIVVEGQGTSLGSYGAGEADTPRMDVVAESGLVFESVSSTAGASGLHELLAGAHPAPGDQDSLAVAWAKQFARTRYRTGLIGGFPAAVEDSAPFEFLQIAEDRDTLWRLRQLDRFLDRDDGRPWCLVLHLDVASFLAPVPGGSSPSPGSPEHRKAVQMADRAAGAALDLLVDRGLANNLIGIYTSDCEPSCGQPDARGAVPMIAFGKTVVPGRRPEPLEHADLLPTFLELAGQASHGTTGRSFAAALRGQPLGTASAPWRAIDGPAPTGAASR